MTRADLIVFMRAEAAVMDKHSAKALAENTPLSAACASALAAKYDAIAALLEADGALRTAIAKELADEGWDHVGALIGIATALKATGPLAPPTTEAGA